MGEISRWVRNSDALEVAICLLTPLVMLAAIFAFNITLSTVGFLLLMLLCPLSHLFMMRGMDHGSQHMGHDNGPQLVE